ncbi:MAG TPA: cation diffusion facilitator family transporter [Anaeromyxobacteraceae bacterium]|nr:cation diffusion facilitator family transporter [Anaeromyxobacteraceae bacterium]
MSEATGQAERDRFHRHEGICQAHEHVHARQGLAKGGSLRRLCVSLGVASIIMIAEALGGWFSGSLALISDAGHMLTDVAALGLALLAVFFAARPADVKRTFGFRRLEVLAAQVNVATLLILTGWIAWSALQRLRFPHPPIELGVMAGVAAIGVVGNSVILLWLHGDHNLNARAAFLHVLGDAVASLAVLVGAGAMWVRPDLGFIDPLLSLGIAILILWGAFRLILEISEILMEAVPRHLDVAEISRSMEVAHAGVVAVHDLHVWTISTGLHALCAHLVIDAEAIGRNDAILTCVKSILRSQYGIDHTTLQIETAQYEHVHDVHDH